MPQSDSFHDLIARVRSGDPEAETSLFQQYAGRLIALARTHLDSVIRQKVDPEEVVQSAFGSFFPRLAGGQFELENWQGLWSLLVKITLRKCGKRIRHFHRAARDVRREVHVSAGSSEDQAVWETLSSDPTPSEAAVLAEMVEHMMRGLEGRDRQILELRLQGHKVLEISAQVSRTEHSVEAVLRRVRKRLQRQLDQEDQTP
jgi:RNA polymerase sigma-70 factor (ECF subfamily)